MEGASIDLLHHFFCLLYLRSLQIKSIYAIDAHSRFDILSDYHLECLSGGTRVHHLSSLQWAAC